MAKVGNLANFTPCVVASVDKAFGVLQISHRSVLVDVIIHALELCWPFNVSVLVYG